MLGKHKVKFIAMEHVVSVNETICVTLISFMIAAAVLLFCKHQASLFLSTIYDVEAKLIL